ncbi:GbsR/MarR family transcriptional regulator [Novosphingobium album (ex Liu et al. 2023)]|uniref:Transcriptional regulator n=1 Tax=Novosphingobium album (ex Liu et al. 2023) TaxID=3031130 RepID=A0ABT5WUL4_9SPHN|nr:transcriptional regulator [Novosphingobium album (ex Liu et al. 2023)]MDE8653556.1 transcriptional regulator [Novosphingobium album (ex Liu et al. 2023)]
MTQAEFIHGFSKLMANWGMPLTAGRVYAYLLLQPKAVSLDQIAAGLGISKASAWGAAKHLEQVGQIERYGEQGSKRSLFSATEDFARSLVRYSKLLSRIGGLLRDGAPGAEAEAAARMRERSGFYLTVHDAIEATIGELTTGQRRAAAE